MTTWRLDYSVSSDVDLPENNAKDPYFCVWSLPTNPIGTTGSRIVFVDRTWTKSIVTIIAFVMMKSEETITMKKRKRKIYKRYKVIWWWRPPHARHSKNRFLFWVWLYHQRHLHRHHPPPPPPRRPTPWRLQPTRRRIAALNYVPWSIPTLLLLSTPITTCHHHYW